MHLFHAAFDDRKLPFDERHPTRHASHGERPFGTLEVVALHFPRLSPYYRTLMTASHAVRYASSPMKGDGQRFWDAYDVVAKGL